jgi:hypothetical protein
MGRGQEGQHRQQYSPMLHSLITQKQSLNNPQKKILFTNGIHSFLSILYREESILITKYTMGESQ